MSKGIDYGMGQTNIDNSNGIRYGVIPMNAVCQAWCDSSEGYYGEPHCPECGNEANSPDDAMPNGQCDVVEYSPLHSWSMNDHVCQHCKVYFGSDEAYGDEAISHYIDDAEYSAECGQDGDIFIMRSPFYTRAAFCSPCAPGACYLRSPDDDGAKAYCFGPDWFQDDSPCPYPVYRVDTDECVYTPAE